MRNNFIRKTDAGILNFLFILSALSLFVYVFALPPFHFGFWPQSEPPITLFFVLNSAISGCLIWLAFRRKMLFSSIFRHPFVLLPFLIGAWTMLMSIFLELPVLSWFGSPENAEGGLLYLSLALQTAAFLLLLKFPRFKKILWVSALIAAGILTTLTFRFSVENPWVPYFFKDYIAFVGLFLGVFLATANMFGKKIDYILGGAIGSVIIYVSGNNSAFGLLAVIVPLFLGMQFIPVVKRNWKAWMAVGAALAPLVITIALVTLGHPNSPFYWGSIKSRYHLAEVVVSSIEERPEILLHGNGWGTYQDKQAAHLQIGQIGLVDDLDGIFWEGKSRHHFHSHNNVLEMLLSIGVVGVLLMLAYLLVTPLYAKRHHLYPASFFAVFFGALGAAWFQLIVSWPFMALAYASIRGKNPEWVKRLRMPSSVLVPLLTAVLGLQLFAAVTIPDVAMRAMKFGHEELSGTETCTDQAYDFGRGGWHYAKIYRDFLYFMRRVVDPTLIEEGETFESNIVPVVSDQNAAKIANLLCIERKYIEEGRAGIRLRLVGLLARADIAFALAPKFVTPEKADEMLIGWEMRLIEFLALAPQRTDQAAPYLLWRLSQNNEEAMMPVINYLKENNPDNPVTLWFDGMQQLSDPEHGHLGLQKMKRALDKGVARIIYIDENLRQMVEQAH